MKNVKKAQLGVNKSLLKEFNKNGDENNRTVFMENGEEFQIQLFNPYDCVVGVEISLNGDVQHNQLILKPGEKVWIERQLDKPVKFKFETYEVEANNTYVEKAIANNGVLTFKFYKERKIEMYKSCPSLLRDLVWDGKFYDGDYSGVQINTNNLTTSIGNLCCSSVVNADAATDTYYSNTLNNNFSLSSKTCTNSIKKETGRIEEGRNSNQKFKNAYYDLEYFPVDTETIHILPISEKQYNASDAVKRYCPQCGRKLKQQYKFCPFCGERLE